MADSRIEWRILGASLVPDLGLTVASEIGATCEGEGRSRLGCMLGGAAGFGGVG
jgi:hypothetical protein